MCNAPDMERPHCLHQGDDDWVDLSGEGQAVRSTGLAQ